MLKHRGTHSNVQSVLYVTRYMLQDNVKMLKSFKKLVTKTKSRQLNSYVKCSVHSVSFPIRMQIENLKILFNNILKTSRNK